MSRFMFVLMAVAALPSLGSAAAGIEEVDRTVNTHITDIADLKVGMSMSMLLDNDFQSFDPNKHEVSFGLADGYGNQCMFTLDGIYAQDAGFDGTSPHLQLTTKKTFKIVRIQPEEPARVALTSDELP